MANEAEVNMLAITEYDEKKQRRLDRLDGEDRLASLCQLLSDAGRTEDMKRVWSDHAFREECFKEFDL